MIIFMTPTIKMCYLQTYNTMTAFFFPFKSDHLVHFRGWVVSGKLTCLLFTFFIVVKCT